MMQAERWLLGLILIILLGLTACAAPVSAGPTSDSPVGVPRPGDDFPSILLKVASGSWQVFEAVGTAVTWVGTASPGCLGAFICLIVLPLMGLGFWTFKNMRRIMALMELQDGVRSFLDGLR